MNEWMEFFNASPTNTPPCDPFPRSVVRLRGQITCWDQCLFAELRKLRPIRHGLFDKVSVFNDAVDEFKCVVKHVHLWENGRAARGRNISWAMRELPNSVGHKLWTATFSNPFFSIIGTQAICEGEAPRPRLHRLHTTTANPRSRRGRSQVIHPDLNLEMLYYTRTIVCPNLSKSETGAIICFESATGILEAHSIWITRDG